MQREPKENALSDAARLIKRRPYYLSAMQARVVSDAVKGFVVDLSEEHRVLAEAMAFAIGEGIALYNPWFNMDNFLRNCGFEEKLESER